MMWLLFWEYMQKRESSVSEHKGLQAFPHIFYILTSIMLLPQFCALILGGLQIINPLESNFGFINSDPFLQMTKFRDKVILKNQSTRLCFSAELEDEVSYVNFETGKQKVAIDTGASSTLSYDRTDFSDFVDIAPGTIGIKGVGGVQIY